MPDPQVKVCLITGATSGIGRAAAIQLAEVGLDLALTGRNQVAGKELVARITRRNSGVRAEFFPAEISRPSEVRLLAERVRGRFSQLDILINNAGARFDTYQETLDGIERTFATNHLGHFLLTALLLDRLLAAPSARIVVTGSSAHFAAPESGGWCLVEKEWNRKVAYAKSKLANVVFAYELARRLKDTKVTVNVADPGTPVTRFARNNGLLSWLKHVGYHLTKGELSSAATAGHLLAKLASSSEFEGVTGGYFSVCGQEESSLASRQQELAQALWNLSVKMSGADEHLSAVWERLKPAPQP